MTAAPKITKSEPSNGASGSGVEPGSTTNDHQPRPRSEEPDFPVMHYSEAKDHLRRPFTAEAVKFKVQRLTAMGAEVVTYIDARLVIERLNLVVGGDWQERFERVQDGLLCRLEVAGVLHEDVGDGKGKAAYSDALKRAAVKHGIGVSIYALPTAKVRADKLRKDGKATVLTGEGEKWLRDGYAGWLERTGAEKFGEPLDHGDVIGAQGDPEAESEPAPVEAELDYQPPEPVKGKEAELIRNQIEKFYDEIRAIDPSFLLPAVYRRELQIAGGSVEDLKTYRDFMVERLSELARS
jgi:hypothetical protein